MSSNKLDVGASVRFTRPERFEAMPKAEAEVYRIESFQDAGRRHALRHQERRGAVRAHRGGQRSSTTLMMQMGIDTCVLSRSARGSSSLADLRAGGDANHRLRRRDLPPRLPGRSASRQNATITEALAEFTLQGQTVNDWTKLFAFHAYPTAGTTPPPPPQCSARSSRRRNKDANFAITKVPDSDESIIDFLTWAPGSDVMEFDVFKYAKDASGKGLVALQYAQHIKAKDMDVADFRKVRERMVEEMVGTDISPARDYFSDDGPSSNVRRKSRQV